MSEIAKAWRTTVAEVNEAIDRWCDEAITHKTRKHTLTLELARLDFYQRALESDLQCGALVTKFIERRYVVLGLHTPQTAVLKIVEEPVPRETSTDKIERGAQRADRGSAEEERRADHALICRRVIHRDGAAVVASATLARQSSLRAVINEAILIGDGVGKPLGLFIIPDRHPDLQDVAATTPGQFSWRCC